VNVQVRFGAMNNSNENRPIEKSCNNARKAKHSFFPVMSPSQQREEADQSVGIMESDENESSITLIEEFNLEDEIVTKIVDEFDPEDEIVTQRCMGNRSGMEHEDYQLTSGTFSCNNSSGIPKMFGNALYTGSKRAQYFPEYPEIHSDNALPKKKVKLDDCKVVRDFNNRNGFLAPFEDAVDPLSPIVSGNTCPILHVTDAVSQPYPVNDLEEEAKDEGMEEVEEYPCYSQGYYESVIDTIDAIDSEITMAEYIFSEKKNMTPIPSLRVSKGILNECGIFMRSGNEEYLQKHTGYYTLPGLIPSPFSDIRETFDEWEDSYTKIATEHLQHVSMTLGSHEYAATSLEEVRFIDKFSTIMRGSLQCDRYNQGVDCTLRSGRWKLPVVKIANRNEDLQNVLTISGNKFEMNKIEQTKTISLPNGELVKMCLEDVLDVRQSQYKDGWKNAFLSVINDKYFPDDLSSENVLSYSSINELPEVRPSINQREWIQKYTDAAVMRNDHIISMMNAGSSYNLDLLPTAQICGIITDIFQPVLPLVNQAMKRGRFINNTWCFTLPPEVPVDIGLFNDFPVPYEIHFPEGTWPTYDRDLRKHWKWMGTQRFYTFEPEASMLKHTPNGGWQCRIIKDSINSFEIRIWTIEITAEVLTAEDDIVKKLRFDFRIMQCGKPESFHPVARGLGEFYMSRDALACMNHRMIYAYKWWEPLFGMNHISAYDLHNYYYNNTSQLDIEWSFKRYFHSLHLIRHYCDLETHSNFPDISYILNLKKGRLAKELAIKDGIRYVGAKLDVPDFDSEYGSHAYNDIMLDRRGFPIQRICSFDIDTAGKMLAHRDIRKYYNAAIDAGADLRFFEIERGESIVKRLGTAFSTQCIKYMEDDTCMYDCVNWLEYYFIRPDAAFTREQFLTACWGKPNYNAWDMHDDDYTYDDTTLPLRNIIINYNEEEEGNEDVDAHGVDNDSDDEYEY